MMEKEATNEENTTTTTRENNKMDISQLEAKSKDELMELAKEMELSDYVDLTKQDLTMRLLQAEAEQQGKRKDAAFAHYLANKEKRQEE